MRSRSPWILPVLGLLASALVALLLPIMWGLLSRLRNAQDQRAELLERAVDASNDERRRIAGTLHDGVTVAFESIKSFIA